MGVYRQLIWKTIATSDCKSAASRNRLRVALRGRRSWNPFYTDHSFSNSNAFKCLIRRKRRLSQGIHACKVKQNL